MPEPPPEYRFRPGVSGNPTGTSKDAAALARLARERAPEALDEITRIMKEGRKDRDRLTAAAMILDRAYGRPAQAVHVTNDDLPSAGVRSEAAERARQIMEKAIAVATGADAVEQGPASPPGSRSLQ